jgi:phage terminase Nu1 subunit (DNA packaging protein)
MIEPSTASSAYTLFDSAVLDLSVRHVRRLTRDGVLKLIRRDGKHPRYRLADSVQQYLKHQKHYITADLSRPDDAYRAARTERMCALAKIEQIRVDEMRGRLHRAEDIEFCLTNMLTFMKQRLLAIPSRITRVLIGQTDFKTIYAAIDNEIWRCLDGAVSRRLQTNVSSAAQSASGQDDGGNARRRATKQVKAFYSGDASMIFANLCPLGCNQQSGHRKVAAEDDRKDPAGPKKERPSRGICLRSSERDERIRHDDADGDVIDLSG